MILKEFYTCIWNFTFVRQMDMTYPFITENYMQYLSSHFVSFEDSKLYPTESNSCKVLLLRKTCISLHLVGHENKKFLLRIMFYLGYILSHSDTLACVMSRLEECYLWQYTAQHKCHMMLLGNKNNDCLVMQWSHILSWRSCQLRIQVVKCYPIWCN